MKVLLSSFGSSGDYNPFLAFGRAMKEAGHEVLFQANPYYESIITGAGLKFIPAGEYLDTFEYLQNEPNLMDKSKGPRILVNDLVIPNLKEMYPAAEEMIKSQGVDLVVSHFLELGVLYAAIKNGVPYGTLTTTPSVWMSAEKLPHYGHLELPVWLHKWIIKLARISLGKILQRRFRSTCRKLSLPLEYVSWNNLFDGAMVNLGAWSNVLRAKAGDDPPRSYICGFFRDEGVVGWDNVPDDVEQFMAKENKPVVVGMGSTASLHGDKIYETIIPACKQLNRPLLLVGAGLEKYNDPVNNILTVPFAPFGWLFPKAHAIVHHGGLNTTGEALRAGVPSIVVPFSYDQFDNAFMVEKMGAGKRLNLDKLTTEMFYDSLKSLAGDAAIYNRISMISDMLKSEQNGAKTAVEIIEREFASRDFDLG